MGIPTRPRYEFATQAALQVITHFNVSKFPIDVKAMIKSKGIKLKRYSVIAKQIGITVEDVCHNYETDLAYICRQENGQYAIAYNDTKPEHLIRFSLAHELGHYSLMHLEDFEETALRYRGNSLTEEKYQVLEKEANCFARNLLSPMPLVLLFKERNTYDVMDFFGIGFKAAETRIGFLSADYENTRKCLTENTTTFFRSLRVAFKYQHHCERCGAITIGKNTCCCSICGHTKLIHLTPDGYHLHKDFGGEIMEYAKIPLDDKGYALKCPVCDNEKFVENSKICQICGTSRHNMCLGRINEHYGINGEKIHPIDLEKNGCGATLSGNSRFCHICTGTSSFSYQGLLKSWKLENRDTFLDGLDDLDDLDLF